MNEEATVFLMSIVFFSLGFFPLWIFSRVVVNKLINEIEKLKKELKQLKNKTE